MSEPLEGRASFRSWLGHSTLFLRKWVIALSQAQWSHVFLLFLQKLPNMEIVEIKDTILSFEDLLSEQMKKYIHYKSMRNFVLHFDEIRGAITRERIIKLLASYIEEVRAKDYDFSGKEESLQLARKYMPTLSGYFKDESNFMAKPSLKLILVTGVIADGAVSGNSSHYLI